MKTSISMLTKIGLIASVNPKIFPYPFHDGFHPKNSKETLIINKINELCRLGVDAIYVVTEFETDRFFREYTRGYGSYKNLPVYFLDYHENQRSFLQESLWQCLWATNQIYNCNNKISKIMIPEEYVFSDLYVDCKHPEALEENTVTSDGTLGFIRVDERKARNFFKGKQKILRRMALTKTKEEIRETYSYDKLLKELELNGTKGVIQKNYRDFK